MAVTFGPSFINLSLFGHTTVTTSWHNGGMFLLRCRARRVVPPGTAGQMTTMTNSARPRSGVHISQMLLVVLMLAGGALPGTAFAQPITRDFEHQAPAPGELMPEAIVYDRDGKELRLRELLQEHYTVLVLGCLT